MNSTAPDRRSGSLHLATSSVSSSGELVLRMAHCSPHRSLKPRDLESYSRGRGPLQLGKVTPSIQRAQAPVCTELLGILQSDHTRA